MPRFHSQESLFYHLKSIDRRKSLNVSEFCAFQDKDIKSKKSVEQSYMITRYFGKIASCYQNLFTMQTYFVQSDFMLINLLTCKHLQFS